MWEIFVNLKYICEEANSFDSVISEYKEILAYLEELKAVGFTYADYSDPNEGYFYFVTDDPVLAEKYEADEVEFEEDTPVDEP